MIDMKKALQSIDDVIEKGPYKDTWASLSSWQTPKWYQKAKFGIFIHWGVYSVPAFDSEWYPRNMYIEGSKVYEHHIKTYGAHKDFGYKDFIPMFKAEKFDPNAWAALFKKAGAKYVVPVAEHHDGFQMYRSNISHWNAYEMGPKRDIVGELKAAVEAQGMTLGVSSHRIEHWFFMSNGKKFESDMPQNPDRDDLYWPSMPDPENFDAMRHVIFFGGAKCSAEQAVSTVLSSLFAVTNSAVGPSAPPMMPITAAFCASGMNG